MSVWFSGDAFTLLDELSAHNDREWFTRHAAAYRRLLLEPFARLLAAASASLTSTAWPVAGGRRTMARPLRDQRYARDAPYRTCVRGLLTSTGRTPTREGCVHVELSSGGGFVGVGFHRPPRDVIDPVRRRMLTSPDAWDEVRRGLAASGRELPGDRLRRLPSGFAAYASHRHADDLRLRSIVFVDTLDVQTWISGSALHRIVAAATDGAELLRFGNTAPA